MLLILAVFTVVGGTIYGRSLSYDFVSFDDDILVYDNPSIREVSPASIAWIFTRYDPELYIPLTFLSYQLDHSIAGLNPWMFHLQNLVLHTVNASLVAVFLSLLLQNRYVALFCGLVFLVHPQNTEIVSWVSARKDLLSTMFFLFGCILYVHKGPVPSDHTFRKVEILFALGLMAKVSVVVLPVALLLLDWLRGRKLSLVLLQEKLILFALAVFFGLVAIAGKQSVLSDSSLLEGVLVSAKAMMLYVQKFFFPVNFSVLYPYIEPVHIASLFFLVPLLLVLFVTALSVWSLRHGRQFVFAGSWFFLTVFASFTNYAKVGGIYLGSDRYAYIPSIGLLFIVGWLILHFCSEEKTRRVAVTVCCVFLLFCAAQARAQSSVWKNTYSLFSHVLTETDSSHIANTKIGGLLVDQEEYEKATLHLNRSLDIKPTERAYYNLGIIALHNFENSKALTLNREAVAINDAYVPAHINLSYLYWEAGNTDQALDHAKKAVTLAPDDEDAMRNLSAIRKQLGR